MPTPAPVQPGAAVTAPTSSAAPSTRLVSLDALRGFDMFWILGADALVHALARTWDIPPLRALAQQFEHKAWAGFAFYDLIFPLFVFIVGVSCVFSLSRLRERHGTAGAVRRVLVRGTLLFLLGIVYSGGLSNPWPDIRLLGVLQRIALAYTATGLLFCFLKPRALAGVTAGLLVGYWALLTFFPIRNVQVEREALPRQLNVAQPTMAQAREAYFATHERVTGGYEPGRNLTNHLDFEYLPGRKYDLYYDPEGLLSTLPAIATCLLGVFAGLWLRRADWSDRQKVQRLLLAGLAALVVGWLWHLQFPVVKKIWTSSYVLVAGGWSLLLLAAFYYVVDVRGKRTWCVPFVWIGMNAITLYLISGIVGFRRLAQRLAGGDVQAGLDRLQPGAGALFLSVVALALMLVLARFLYRRQIFLRL